VTSIQIILNGETREIGSSTQLDELLKLFSLPKQRIAIELNGNVIRRADWADITIADGDSVEVVHFVGGG